MNEMTGICMSVNYLDISTSNYSVTAAFGHPAYPDIGGSPGVTFLLMPVFQADIRNAQNGLTNDITGQPCGVYFLRIRTSGKIVVSKIIKI